MSKPDEDSFRPIIKIIAYPRKSGSGYSFNIPSAFIKNRNILPNKKYIIFIGEYNEDDKKSNVPQKD